MLEDCLLLGAGLLVVEVAADLELDQVVGGTVPVGEIVVADVGFDVRGSGLGGGTDASVVLG